jgi:hypothetical protein
MDDIGCKGMEGMKPVIRWQRKDLKSTLGSEPDSSNTERAGKHSIRGWMNRKIRNTCSSHLEGNITRVFFFKTPLKRNRVLELNGNQLKQVTELIQQPCTTYASVKS